MSYDLPWANVSNTPFRRYKHYVHEGGIATPLIAVWPGAVPAGGMEHAPCHVVDVLPTCLEAAGATYPTEYEGRSILPAEGESFLSLVRGVAWQRGRALAWEHEGNRAVRLGSLKLVSAHPGAWELYDVHAGRAELHDLAARYPADVQRLGVAYDEWVARTGVLPWDEVRDRSPKFARAVSSKGG
jgi:arylsulfatase